MPDFPKRIVELPKEVHEFTSYKLEAKDCDIYFSELSTETRVSPHSHEVDVLNFVAEGSLWVSIEGQETEYSVGDWVSIPANVQHSIRTKSHTRLIEL